MTATSSRELLWRLIGRRLEPDADRDAIDARIRELFEEIWAVVFTDLVGFSRRTREFGILHFLSLIYEKGRLLEPTIEEAGGRILKEEADSWLILFRSPVRAVRTMIECQRLCAAHNADRAGRDRVELCVGIGYGPVLRIGDEDVWGPEVNIASKLGEDTARSGEILVSDGAREGLRAEGVTDLRFERREGHGMPGDCWRLVV